MSIADQARKIPGVAAAEGAITGAVATEQDLPIADYDKQTADEIAKFTGEEPWSGYDEQSVDAITTALRDTDDDTAAAVRTYERQRKNRAGVIQAADQRTGN